MRLISADALLEHLFSKQDEDIDIAKEIAEFPSVNQWIPCSERRPGEGDVVMVTYEGVTSVPCLEKTETSEEIRERMRRTRAVTICERERGCWRNLLFYLNNVNSENAKVLAWMPLPEPWKGEEDA